ncbi:zinc-binding dehydrogenase [Microbacterium album]|uniref:Alcohol dehydrogenase n=1 Tax=Microbacterium album TaxID=2053191 RepID=A0A917IGS7_9MICO|nr:Zn-dependent alcohol dehydrogenase [Microbacterium album]GGH42332.1 alcohol dehydrogenase [Microbacterium album]
MSAGVGGTAAVLHGLGERLVLEEVRWSEPAPQEVLVRIEASGICRSDLTVSRIDNGFPLPLILGHEIAGVVERVGSAVTSLSPGDHVVACPVNHCGRCRSCRIGEPFRCSDHAATQRRADEEPRVSADGRSLTQFIGIGGFSTHTVMHENLVVRVPRELPFHVACLLGCGVATGLGAALHSARVGPGDTVLVIGCGGVGLNVVQGARLAGARRIIAVDRNPAALALATELGATEALQADEVDVVAAVKEITGGGVSHAFEVIGVPDTVGQAMDALRKGGTAYLVGVQRPDAVLGIPFRHFFEQKGIRGVAMGSTVPHVHIPEYADLYLQGRLYLDALVANRIPLADVNDGFDRLLDGALARSVIEFA